MPRLFTGSPVHKLEARGRVSLPSRFRRVLKDFETQDIYMVPQMRSDLCHHCFSEPAYEAMIRRFEKGDHSDIEEAGFLETVHASTEALIPDDAGRIVIPEEHRNSIGLTSEVCFVGRGDYFEIWDPAQHALHGREVAEAGREVARKVSLKGLLR